MLWIAYLKNENNNECIIAQLPKDIIRHIIEMFTGIHIMIDSNDNNSSGDNANNTK